MGIDTLIVDDKNVVNRFRFSYSLITYHIRESFFILFFDKLTELLTLLFFSSVTRHCQLGDN